MNYDCPITEKLKVFANRLGGEIRGLGEDEYDVVIDGKGFYDCPFKSYHGILWNEKRVVYKYEPSWTTILHEMGHVFACKVPPTICEEFNFFGWEYLFAKHLDRVDEWEEAQEEYGIAGYAGPNDKCYEFEQFGELPREGKDAFINYCIERGVKVGCIVNGVPVSVR